MNDIRGVKNEIEKRNGKAARWFENFFMMGGWILILVATLAACAAIRTLLNY